MSVVGSSSACGERLAACICAEPPGHELPHKCARSSAITEDGLCRGQWNNAEDIVVWPTGETDKAEALAHLRRIRVGFDPGWVILVVKP